MARFLSLLVLVASASALMTGAPLATRAAVSRSDVSMACNGGKGGSGGMSPKKDKDRRGKFKRLVNVVSVHAPLRR